MVKTSQEKESLVKVSMQLTGEEERGLTEDCLVSEHTYKEEDGNLKKVKREREGVMS